MSDNSKLLLGFIVGAAAGAALGAYFSTDKGKELLSRIKDTALDLADDVKSAAERVRSMAEEDEPLSANN